jgi:hypothetical protein
MRAAETLPIGRVQKRPTIAALDDVIGEHAVRRRRLRAATTGIDRLTSVSSATIHLVSPASILGRLQFSVGLLGLQLHCPRVEHTNGWLHHMKLCHSLILRESHSLR